MDFFLGGVAAMGAGLFSNPFDVIKTRQQLQGELQTAKGAPELYGSIYQSIRNIIKAEGVSGLQRGLGAALSFQFIMNSTRLGFYQTVTDLGLTKFDKKNSYNSMPLCVFWGGIAGILGSIVGCPFSLVKTQMQAQSVGKYCVGFQHHHANTFMALVRIVKKQGYFGLWRGLSGNSSRAAIGSSAQLSAFSTSKDYLKEFELFKKSYPLTVIGASMVSGLAVVVTMTPFDVVATRIFNQGLDEHGRGLLYKNVPDCFFKTLRYEGLKGLYKGIVTNYWRITPHTILSLTFWEELKRWNRIYFNA